VSSTVRYAQVVSGACPARNATSTWWRGTGAAGLSPCHSQPGQLERYGDRALRWPTSPAHYHLHAVSHRITPAAAGRRPGSAG
jgi:hypothetical protein